MRKRDKLFWIVILTVLTANLFIGGCMKKSTCKRVGWVIEIEEKNIAEYKALHANAWPKVLKTLKEHNIQNYSIFLGEIERNRYYLFSYFEYVGNDMEADMKEIGEQPIMKKWLEKCSPLQKPIETRKDGEWWHDLEQVFYMP
jgi:L-rhamnose mutarotase